jgi:hypothetical protein
VAAAAPALETIIVVPPKLPVLVPAAATSHYGHRADRTAEKALGAVLQAVAAGKLSVEEGDKLAGTIGRLGEAVHMRLVEERLAALEATSNAKTITYQKG